jgi:TonB family protein
MLRPIILSVALAACATGSPLNQTSTPAYQSRLSLVDSSPTLPQRRVRLELPTSREMARSSSQLSASVELCVSPGGETETVRLTNSSGDRVFDNAVIADVNRLQYRPLAGSSLACEHATITYMP